MLYYTAKNPQWQDRLRAESLALGKAQLEYDDLDKMTGLELVFKESLRMNPSVAMMTRRTIRECEIDGVRIPANTVLYLPPAFNHYDSKHWSNPEKFDPERFLPERQEEKNHSFCYTPFGGGAHKCIGLHFANMQAKCFMHQFLQKYRYSVPANYNPKMDIFPLPKPADGLPLKLEAII
jgi:cytochrome P450